MKKHAVVLMGAFSLSAFAACNIQTLDEEYADVEQGVGLVQEEEVEPTKGWSFSHNPNAPAVTF